MARRLACGDRPNPGRAATSCPSLPASDHRDAGTIRGVALIPLIAFGIAALALAVLGIAGPVYRLGASLPSAYAVMRWAEYLGAAAALVAVGSAIYSFRGRKWTGTLVSVLALVLGLTAVAIPLMWQRREL